MRKLPTRLIAGAGSLVVAGIIAVPAMASAAPATAATPAVSGTEHFQMVTASATATKAPVIGYGLFGAAGVDHMGSSVDKFVFKSGTFKVRHSEGTGSPQFNSRTCAIFGKIRGTYKIFGGTGKYAGISGHGHYVFTLVEIAKRKPNGACVTSQKALPAAVEEIIQASGPVTL